MSSKEARIQETYDALHAMPEVGFEEVKTSAWLAERIKAAGFAVTTGVGGTGIVAVLKGKEAGPVVALRADMDALAHVVDGKDVCVHSCGHDSHCTMVLTAAEELAAAGIKRGTLKILFQPAEEKLFGATRMIEAGAFGRILEVNASFLHSSDLDPQKPLNWKRTLAERRVQLLVLEPRAPAQRPSLRRNASWCP